MDILRIPQVQHHLSHHYKLSRMFHSDDLHFILYFLRVQEGKGTLNIQFSNIYFYDN